MLDKLYVIAFVDIPFAAQSYFSPYGVFEVYPKSKITKFTKIELWELYKIQNKHLKLLDLFDYFQHFPKLRKRFVILSIGFGFCVFNSIWEHRLNLFLNICSNKNPKFSLKCEQFSYRLLFDVFGDVWS